MTLEKRWHEASFLTPFAPEEEEEEDERGIVTNSQAGLRGGCLFLGVDSGGERGTPPRRTANAPSLRVKSIS